MKVRALTLRLDPETGAFDDSALQAFVADRTVISVTEHFFTDGGAPVWALLLTYRDDAPFAEARPSGRRHDSNPAADLAPEERELYDALRAWRSDRSSAEGKPPYLLFNNRQLAAIAKARPRSKAERSGRHPARTAAAVRRCATAWPGRSAWHHCLGTIPATATTTWASVSPARCTARRPTFTSARRPGAAAA